MAPTPKIARTALALLAALGAGRLRQDHGDRRVAGVERRARRVARARRRG
ncbi:hypothetical protein K2Z83_25065 [Oscillochloris sp. ZM17-4]|nr:hypothetical protein [Oscillochloris sp. ZM17-4]MBX0330933.1 hypothetical protein [Oscillochloris sp. ZM17-4]